MNTQTEALRLTEWFDECDGFAQGTQAPHKWVLQANAELHRLHVENEQLRQAIEQAEKQKCPWPDGECTTCKKAEKQEHYCQEWDFMKIDKDSPEFDACLCFPKPSLWFAIHNDGNVKYTTDSARAKGWKESGSYRVVRDYYTAPPKREWVNLTDDELRDALHTCPHDTVEKVRVRWLYAKEFARAIEAKLKEKNT